MEQPTSKLRQLSNSIADRLLSRNDWGTKEQNRKIISDTVHSAIGEILMDRKIEAAFAATTAEQPAVVSWKHR